MTAAGRARAKRWGASVAAAVLATAVVLILFRVPAPTPIAPRTGGAEPPIKLMPGRTDEMTMRDLTPLFLPTRYNAAPQEFHHAPGEPLAPEPGGKFFDRDAVALKFDEDNPVLHLPPPVDIPRTPLQALADMPGPLALGIGRTNATVPAAPASGGHLDVYAADWRDSLLRVTLPATARPKSAAGAELAWKPLEFTAVVDSAGLVAPIVLTHGSGVQDVDSFFRNYLAQTFRIGDRLPPGFYRIVIGP